MPHAFLRDTTPVLGLSVLSGQQIPQDEIARSVKPLNDISTFAKQFLSTFIYVVTSIAWKVKSRISAIFRSAYIFFLSK